MEFLQTWIQGIKDARVQRGLDFAKKIAERHKYMEPYNEFETAIRQCQRGDCPYTVSELRTMSNKIAPGMECVNSVWDAADAVGNEN